MEGSNIIPEYLSKIKEEPEVNFMLILPPAKSINSVINIETSTKYYKDTEKKSTSVLFYCDLCPKRFKTKNLIRQHVQIHSAKVLKCDQCSFITKTQICLRMHQKIMMT